MYASPRMQLLHFSGTCLYFPFSLFNDLGVKIPLVFEAGLQRYKLFLN